MSRQVLSALCVVIAALTTVSVLSGAASSSSDLTGFEVAGSASPHNYIAAHQGDLGTGVFINDYTVNGLSVSSSDGSLPSDGSCRYMAISGGILSVGTLKQQRYFVPYDVNGNRQTGSTLSSPVLFGLTNPPEFIGTTWNTTIAASVYTTPIENVCSSSSSEPWYLTTKAAFAVGATGAGSTPPPHAVLATVNEAKSSHFSTLYNKNDGVETYKGQTVSLDGCCVLAVHGGQFLSLDDGSFIRPFTKNFSPVCSSGTASISGSVYLGTSSGDVFSSMNLTIRTDLKSVGSSSLPNRCSSRPAETFALFKVHPWAGAAPGPDGSCYDTSLRVSFDDSDGICLASRWRHTMRINTTYKTIGMTSLDECSFGVSMYGITIQPYTENHVVVSSTGGATNAPCHGQVIVPYDMRNWTEMATICTYKQSEFNWAEVLFEWEHSNHRAVPFKCPPPPPQKP